MTANCKAAELKVKLLKPTVKIKTFGVSNMQHHGYPEVMQASDCAHLVPNADLFIDCNGMPRLFEDKVACTGLNINAQEHLLERGRAFVDPAVKKLANKLKALRGPPGETFTLAVYCKRGKHRSVAFAELCRRMLLRMDLRVTLDHLSENTDGRRHAGWRHCRCGLCTGHERRREAVCSEGYDILVQALATK